ncbi:hypothetical protein [Parasegetibacter sp. NRK P23]|uniref:hypothetical protein n=1 Tax=Parasegetibacter sp. NRK P23 TaxID=2942999 RepID=UPI002042DDE7|nr:hypothetical protein [Parasegetibacter sp. NRK P23]MCM5529384.1 hypothetical protein [Parasegetibacter sp. NRK P23]
MNSNRSIKDLLVLLLAFCISRVFVSLAGIEMEQNALLRYWQYLDVETLRHNLLAGVWYDHTQPPFFNLLLGIVLKLSGPAAPLAFVWLLKIITLANTFLLYKLVQKQTTVAWMPLAVSLFYLLSPGTIVFEHELFYTTFITLFFLLTCNVLLRLQTNISWKNAFLFATLLLLICFTRSMYHLAWLVVLSAAVYLMLRKRAHSSRLLVAGLAATILVSGWYYKNKVIFGSFSTSTWLGMNLSRNAFHDSEITDSTNIASLPPFQPISTYSKFITKDISRFKGLNDRDLFSEYKNDTFLNVKHAGYIEVSDLYLKSGKEHIKKKPVAFLKNVAQSAIIFFAPATRYSVTEFQARKMRHYDIVYSFNLSHFAKGKQERRIAMVVSALPKILLYAAVFGWLFLQWFSNRKLSPLQWFILLTIAYSFCLSSVFEHYENMRFRFETEPLFLLLLTQAILSSFPKLRNHKPSP